MTLTTRLAVLAAAGVCAAALFSGCGDTSPDDSTPQIGAKADSAANNGGLDGTASDGTAGDGTAATDTPAAAVELKVVSPKDGAVVSVGQKLKVQGEVTGLSGSGPWLVELAEGSDPPLGNVELATPATQVAVDVTVPQKSGAWKLALRLRTKADAKLVAEAALTLKVNNAPGTPTIALQPQPASTADLVKVVISQDAPDIDGDKVTYTYSWTVDGQEAASKSDSLPAGAAKKGQKVAVSVVAFDGYVSGPPATATYTVGNAVPVAAELAAPASPGVALTGEVAAVVAKPATDADNDTLTLTWNWQIGTAKVGTATDAKYTVAQLAQLVGAAIAVGDTISVSQTVSDGTDSATSKAISWTVEAADYCAVVKPCGAHALCTNNGTTSPTCACEPAYIGDGQTCILVGGLSGDTTPTLAADGKLVIELGDPATQTQGPFEIEVVDEQGNVLGSQSAASLGGPTPVEAKVSAPGASKVTVIVKKDGKVIGTRTYWVYRNTAPKGEVVASLSPQPATTQDEVAVELASGATDIDLAAGQTLTYQYAWAKQGQPTSHTGAKLPAGAAKKGEVWTVTITPTDGIDLGTPVTLTFEVANAAPAAVGLSAPASASLLGTASVQLADPPTSDVDGDPVTYTYVWKVNGQVVPGFTGSSAKVSEVDPKAKAGDTIEVIAIASDGTATTAGPATSMTVSGGDDVCASSLNPCAKGAACTNNDSLWPVCACAAGQLGNGLICATIQYVGGPVQVVNLSQGLTATATTETGSGFANGPATFQLTTGDGVPWSGAQTGSGSPQNLSVTVANPGAQKLLVHLLGADGQEIGSAVAIDIYGNSAPSPAPVMGLAPAAPTVLTAIDANMGTPSQDVDLAAGQTLTYAYVWTVDGVATDVTATSLPAGKAKKGQVVAVSVTPWDGYAKGPAGEATVTVGNAAPAAAKVDGSGDIGLLDNPLLVFVDAPKADADGELVTYTIAWYINGQLIAGQAEMKLPLSKVQVGGKAVKVGDKITWTVTASDGTDKTVTSGGPFTVNGQGADVCAVFNPCDKNADCINNGSLTPTCSCNVGYSGDGLTCADIDECKVGTAGCDAHATCANTVGSYTCTCDAGFSGDGKTCTDIDECKTGTYSCDANAACVNVIGAYTCKCNDGWSGNGKTCTDVDECAAGTAICDANAACVNKPGTYACACKAGYAGDGKTCADVDECKAGTFICDTNAACVNTVGAYTCKCNAGWSGDGKTCADVNECTAGTAGCDVNATCANTPGSFTCTCNTGYAGNGKTCTDIDECATESVTDLGVAAKFATWSVVTDAAGGSPTWFASGNQVLMKTKTGATYNGPGASTVPYTTTATSPDVVVGATVTTLDVDLAADIEDDPFVDDFRVGVVFGGKTTWILAKPTVVVGKTSQVYSVSLEPWAGKTVKLILSFAAIDNRLNDGTGIAINKAQLRSGRCGFAGTCKNTAGSYTCSCPTGYALKTNVCVDVDECAAATAGCAVGATCTNLPGSAQCTCGGGQTGDGKVCSNLNECTAAQAFDFTKALAATGWTIGSNLGPSGKVQWQTKAGALMFQDIAKGTYDAGAFHRGWAQSPTTLLPAGQTLNLGIDMKLTTEVSDLLDNLELRVVTDQTSTVVLSKPRAGYAGPVLDYAGAAKHYDIDVSAWAGQSVRFVWWFDTYTADANGFEGPVITAMSVKPKLYCGAGASCFDTVGSYYCACNSGYLGDGKTCTDVNECTAKETTQQAFALAAPLTDWAIVNSDAKVKWQADGKGNLVYRDLFAGNYAGAGANSGSVTTPKVTVAATGTSTLTLTGIFDIESDTGFDTVNLVVIEAGKPNVTIATKANLTLGVSAKTYSFPLATWTGKSVQFSVQFATVDDLFNTTSGISISQLAVVNVSATTPCDAKATCTNTAGSFQCACNPPFAGDGKTCAAPGSSQTNPAASCKAILAADNTAKDGVYWLDPDGSGAIVAYQAYCLMSVQGGGWTLSMKVNGNSTALSYDAAYWTNATLLNATSLDLSASEAKLAPFTNVAGTELLAGMVDGGVTRWVTFGIGSSATLQTKFSGGYVATSIGRNAWKGLMASPSLQPNCNLEGLNAICGGDTKVRIGIVANQENDCNSCDSRIGIGGQGTYCGQDGNNSAGNEATCSADNGDRHTKAFGLVLVR